METRQTSQVRGFTLARPGTLDEALASLKAYGAEACLLSGGTDLVVQLRARKVTPRIVIDLKRVQNLRRDITESESCLQIGGLALLADIIADGRVRRHFPVLAEAASTVGSVQIRNRATLPGNICNASPAADTIPALLVHDAVVNLAGPDGDRSVQLREFFLGPGKTVRRSDEIVASIALPLNKTPVGTAFDRLTRRRGVDLASINVCCLVSSSGLTRFAFGAVGPRPIVADDASGLLADPTIDQQQMDRLLARIIEQTRPISDVRASQAYRSAMLLVLSRRVLRESLGRLRRARQGE